MDLSVLDAACQRYDDVTIEEFIYPKDPSDFKRTCVFKGNDGRRYRVQPNDHYQPHLLGHGVSPHEQIGGLDRFHTYTFWVRRTTRDRQDFPLHHIYYATHRPVEFSKSLLKEMLSSINASQALVSSFKDTFTWTKFRTLLHSKPPPPGATLLAGQIPYVKMRISRRLFRLFPQKTAMDMSLGSFKDIAKALLGVKNPQDAEKTVVSMCFPWLCTVEKLPPLDIEGLLAIDRHYRFASASGMEERAWRSLMLCIEFFQKSLAQNRRGGHTYATPRQLALAYQSAIRWEERSKPTARHVIGDGPALTNATMAQAIASHLPRASRLGIIKVRVVPIDEEGPRVPSNMQRVVYAGDDWIMEDFTTQGLGAIAKEHWTRRVHADGCATEADVLERIRCRRPPSSPAGPQWQTPDFHRRWATLDAKQRRAVVNAVLRPVTFVTGPPGTGKTELFAALKDLFQRGDSIALAAYGRIAKMIEDRIGDAFTFHRAEAITQFRATTDTARTILDSRNCLVDEFGLVTHEHLARVLTHIGNKKARLLFAGDFDQMGAIGSGSIIGSIYRRFSGRPEVFTELDVPHRFLPKYGAGLSADALSRICAARPGSAADPMSVAWNMRQIREYPRTRCLDLVVGDRPGDRFVIVPEGDTFEETLENLRAFGIDNKRFMSLDFQILTHTNKLRRDINRAVRRHVGSLPPQDHRFGASEKITFNKNKYFEDGDGGDEGGVSDVHMDFRRLQQQQQQQQRGQKRGREFTFDYGENGEPPKKRQRKKKPGKDIFNGDVKKIVRIVDENAQTRATAEVSDTGQQRRSGWGRVIQFTEGEGLDLDHYDAHKIESAVAVTGVKYQGSENETVAFWYAPSVHIRRDTLLTNMTRAKKQFIWIGGRTKRAALENIEDAAARDPIRRRERFAYRLDIEPTD